MFPFSFAKHPKVGKWYERFNVKEKHGSNQILGSYDFQSYTISVNDLSSNATNKSQLCPLSNGGKFLTTEYSYPSKHIVQQRGNGGQTFFAFSPQVKFKRRWKRKRFGAYSEIWSTPKKLEVLLQGKKCCFILNAVCAQFPKWTKGIIKALIYFHQRPLIAHAICPRRLVIWQRPIQRAYIK